MGLGDTYVIDGVEMEVVWAGGEGLVGSRESKNIDFWEPPKRIYNKKLKEEDARLLCDSGKSPVVELDDPSED